MASTLEIQEKLNELLEEANKIVEELSKKYKDQVDLLEELTEAAEEMVEALNSEEICNLSDCFEKVGETATKSTGDISKALEDISKKSTSVNASLNSLTDAYSKSGAAASSMNSNSTAMTQATSAFTSVASSAASTASGLFGSITSTIGGVAETVTGVFTGIGGIATSVIGGIGKALSFVGEAVSGLLSFLGSVASAMFSITKSILMFPFDILDKLTAMATSGGGSSELAEALREIRVEFGFLNKSAGFAIISLSKNLSGELANTGLSVGRVFGNLAERLKYFTEYAKNLGEVVDPILRELKASGAEALGAFNKALGFTAAGQKGVAQRALAAGRDLNELNREIANYALQLSSAFGVTMKEVSRDVGEMMADFEHFGSISVKEMTQAAVFARRLGIEVKSLGKLVDKFLNFEDTANSAAQLSQAFGMNIDAFKLMSEQDPAKKMQMLRDSFFATGRTIENMTAQERRLLATQTGLGESELALAFSQKSRSLTYDQIKKKGDSAQKSQLSQTEVLQKLSGAIERLVKSGSMMQGGFFAQFMAGFQTGIESSREFRDLMKALARSLAIVFRAGVYVGRMFVQLFPGVKDFFEGLTSIFNPSVMLRFMDRVKHAFEDFFRMLTTDPSTALPVLLERLQRAFQDRLSDAGPGARRVFEGIKKFAKAVGYILLTGIREAILGLGSTVAPLIANIFSDQTFTSAGNQVREGFSELGTTLSQMFDTVFGAAGSPQRQAIMASLEKFGDAIKDALLFIGIKLVNAAADLIIMIGDALSGAQKGNSNIKQGAESMGDKFIKALGDAFDRSGPALWTLGNKLMELLGTGLLIGLGSFLLRGFLAIFVSLPAIVVGAVSDAIADGVHYLTFTIPKKIIEMVESSFGSDSGFSKGVRAAMSIIATIGASITGVFRFVAGFFTAVGHYFQDFFTQGPAQAMETFINSISRTFIQVKRPIIAAINSLISTIPESLRNMLGLSQIPLPPLPPANNPAVQAINQAVDASRTGGAEINRNLTEGLTLPTSAAATAAAPTSVSDQVSSIRQTIQSASEVGRIDQERAARSMEKLQQFATNLGPILTSTQTALNDALRGVDINKMNENVESIKSIIDNVSRIQQLTSGRTRGISVESLGPIQNSLNALSNFLSGETMTMISETFASAETATRISGIQNTSGAISSMVQAVNSTSAELARLSPISIQTNLNRLAANLGLGNNATYTINNRNFTITVNVDVHMDAKELEDTLLDRTGTRIRSVPRK